MSLNSHMNETRTQNPFTVLRERTSKAKAKFERREREKKKNKIRAKSGSSEARNNRAQVDLT